MRVRLWLKSTRISVATCQKERIVRRYLSLHWGAGAMPRKETWHSHDKTQRQLPPTHPATNTKHHQKTAHNLTTQNIYRIYRHPRTLKESTLYCLTSILIVNNHPKPPCYNNRPTAK